MNSLFFIAATLIFVAGSLLDYDSSLGGREWWWLHRRRDGRFNAPGYVLSSAVIYAAFPVVSYLYESRGHPFWGKASVILAAWGGARIVTSVYNRKVRRR